MLIINGCPIGHTGRKEFPMRLWHKDLIPVLPRQQLLSQWRECCCIARNISVNGTPNHLLVNKILNYPKWHFMQYALLVCAECEKRGCNIDRKLFFKWFDQWNNGTIITGDIEYSNLFIGWHNDRYLRQCLLNLEEKYDCGGIPEDEWQKILWLYGKAF